MMAAPKLNYRDEIATEIIARIEAGTAPWQKPWKAGAIGAAPFNPTSGKPYRGINDMWLTLQGHADPRWLTYNQAAAAGAQVRKGEKSTTVEYWQWSASMPLVDSNGQPVLDADGKPRTQETRLDRPRVFYAKVFNAGQIDGLAPWIAPAPAFDPIERAEALIRGAGIPVLPDQRDRAFYRPATDDIHLPPMAAFHNQASYYETALHELGHATGHPTRLSRSFGPFGSEGYAREELRAEISSYMLARDLGISFDPGNHAGYVESWLHALREDRNEIFHAAKDAEIIKTWVMEPERRPELERAARQHVTAQTRTGIEAREASVRQAVSAMEQTMQDQPASRTHITVPFAERNEAKNLGARWDRTEKSWYIPAGADPAAFAKWTEAKQPPEPEKMPEIQPAPEQPKARTYLAVPFAEKDEVKKLGAHWDRKEKSWYITPDQDPAAFAKWNVKPQAQASSLSPQQEFGQFLKANGLSLKGEPEMDGKWHRVPNDKDKGNEKSGSYRGFLDGRPAGQCINGWNGNTVQWVSTGVALTDEERARIQAEAAQVRADREAQRMAEIEKAAKTAYGIWANLPAPATQQNCPYLAGKGVGGHGVKVNAEGHLVVPLRDEAGKLWNVQFVREGAKHYLKDSQKAGTMHVIEPSGAGTLDSLGRTGGTVVIAEGYATGSRIYEAVHRPVVVAFDCGNLKAVAEAVQAKYPGRPILIAADNDHARVNAQGVPENIGIIKAEEAAKAVGGFFIAPKFTAAEMAKGLTDFDDLGKARGNGAVRGAIEPALARIHQPERSIA